MDFFGGSERLSADLNPLSMADAQFSLLPKVDALPGNADVFGHDFGPNRLSRASKRQWPYCKHHIGIQDPFAGVRQGQTSRSDNSIG